MSTITTIVLQDEQPHMQPAQLKHKASPKTPKHNHEDYDYRDTEDLATEINEFFSYDETKQMVDEHRKGHDHHIQDWRSHDAKETITTLLNTLRKRKDRGNKSLLHQEQINAAKHLICILLCPDRTVQHLIHAVRWVTECDGFDLVCRRLKKIIKKISAFENQATREMIQEFDLYLTLTYLMIETRRQENSDSVMLDLSFVTFLFSFLNQINDQNLLVLPIRKLTLLVWKSMLVIFGGSMTLLNTRSTQSKPGVKSTLQAYYKFIEETTKRYPSYQPSDDTLPSPLTVKATTESISAMGLTRASSLIDLPYQRFCPTLTLKPRKSCDGAPTDQVPFSLIEAGQVYLDCLHPSVAHRQLIEQRDHVIRKQILPDSYPETNELDRFERFYKSILDDLQGIMVFLLKQLLTNLTPSTDVDKSRSQQIQCKSISAILILFLKWAKLSHVLKFEYTSQILVDTGAVLLLMKLFGSQDMAALAGCPSEFENQCLYPAAYQPTNRRNMFWMINLMRILQKLTKAKANRVMIMVQYKPSTVFKKLLKISHPMLELYTLKALKSQVPYQSRKWRANNMKIISAIYLRCQTSLYDDWMTQIDVEDALVEARTEEINLRLLTRIYHGEQYDLPDWLPLYDHQDMQEEEDEMELDPSFVANYEIWLDDDDPADQQDSPETQDKPEEESMLQRPEQNSLAQEISIKNDTLAQEVSIKNDSLAQEVSIKNDPLLAQDDPLDQEMQLLELDDDDIPAFEDDEDDDDISTPEDDTLEISDPLHPDYFYYSGHKKSAQEKNDWIDPSTHALQIHQQQKQKQPHTHSI